MVAGLAYALVSLAWGLGSTWSLDTVGGTLEAEGRAGNPALKLIVWMSAVLKLTAAGLGVAVVLPLTASRRLVVWAAWTAAVVLTIYGGTLTLGGLPRPCGAMRPWMRALKLVPRLSDGAAVPDLLGDRLGQVGQVGVGHMAPVSGTESAVSTRCQYSARQLAGPCAAYP